MMKVLSDHDLANVPAGRILGIDFGTRRIGVALSDPYQMLASTHSTLRNDGMESLVEALKKIIADNSVRVLVVGMPYNMDGSLSDRTKQVKEVLARLEQSLQLPLVEWDERWSSISAEKALIESGRSPSRNRDKVDQVAAAFILQNFLDRLDRFKKNQNVTKD